MIIWSGHWGVPYSFEINFEIPSTNFGQIHKDAISESLTGLYETLHRLDSAYDFAEDEDSQCRHQDGEAIHHAQYYQLVLQRHDAQVREYKQNQKSQKRDGARCEYRRNHFRCSD